MEPNSTAAKQPLHIRVPLPLHAEVAAFARRTHRSLNGAATYLLERGLERDAGFSAERVYTR